MPSARNRPIVAQLLCGVAVTVVFGTLAPTVGGAEAKRARPPKFGKSVTDVFFNDARERLLGSRPQQVAASVAAAAPAASTAAPKGPGWSKLISSDVVEDEVKVQLLKLGEAVASTTKFKGGDYQRARLSLSVLATLFAIDAQYDQPMRWQGEAPAVRDRLARAGFNCKVGTDNSYHEALARTEELQNLVRGGASDPASAPADADWNKVADRAPLMKRLEESQQQGLAVWTANSSEFARRSDKLVHEAEMVAALAEVILQNGYEFADDETYRQYARSMQGQAIAVRDAVRTKSYDQARAAVGEIGKACSNCHEGYRN